MLAWALRERLRPLDGVNRFPRDWFLAKFAKANPLLTAKQLREKVLAANSRLVGTLHLIIQACVLVTWEPPKL